MHQKNPQETSWRQIFIWGVQKKQVEEEIAAEKQACLTCGHSPDDWGLSLLAVHQDCEAVGILHTRGQARYHNAARIRDDLTGSLSTLAWAHTKLQRRSKAFFSVLSTPIPWSYQQFCLVTQHGSVSSIPTTNPVTCFRYPELKLSCFVPLAVISPPSHNEERGKGTWHFGFSYLETNSWGRCPGDDDWSLSHFCVKRRNGANRLICEEN